MSSDPRERVVEAYCRKMAEDPNLTYFCVSRNGRKVTVFLDPMVPKAQRNAYQLFEDVECILCRSQKLNHHPI